MNDLGRVVSVFRQQMRVLFAAGAVLGAQSALAESWSPASLPANCVNSPTPASRGYVNMYKGHYIGVPAPSASVPDPITTVLNEIKDKDRLVGIQKKYYWSDLHTGANTFDFQEMSEDIAKVNAFNNTWGTKKKLSIFVLYKYKTESGGSVVPTYLRNNLGSAAEHPLFSGSGSLAAMDNTTVRDGFIKFMKAMQVRFSANSADSAWDKTVAFIQLTETALGASGVPETAYFNNLREIDKQAACAFQHTPIVQNTNFPRGQLDDFVATFKANGVVMGAPDIWLNDASVDDTSGAYGKYDDLFMQTGIAATVAMNNFEMPSRDEEEKMLAGEAYLTNAEWNPAYLGTAAGRVNAIVKKATVDPTGTVINYAYNLYGRTVGANFVVWRRIGPANPEYQTILERGRGMDTTHPDGPLPMTNRDCPSAWGANVLRWKNNGDQFCAP